VCNFKRVRLAGGRACACGACIDWGRCSSVYLQERQSSMKDKRFRVRRASTCPGWLGCKLIARSHGQAVGHGQALLEDAVLWSDGAVAATAGVVARRPY
jgi:hypothetical protein